VILNGYGLISTISTLGVHELVVLADTYLRYI